MNHVNTQTGAKLVQITIVSDAHTQDLYGLDSDGRIWLKSPRMEWREMPGPFKESEEPRS